MAFGIDYAWGKLNIAEAKKAGVHFVCRYVSTPGNSKNISRDEAAALHKAGIDIVIVFETIAKRALNGSGAGHVDAISARKQVLAAGLPASTPIYFAVDFDATPQQQPTINAYLKSAAEALGGRSFAGVYGGYWVVKRALDAGVVKYGWQTYAWSGGHWDARAHIQQYSNGHHLAGVSCDYDRSMKSDFGSAYGVHAPTPPPIPKPPPVPQPGPKPDPTPPAKGKWLKITDKDNSVTFVPYSKLARARRGTQFARGKFKGVNVVVH